MPPQWQQQQLFVLSVKCRKKKIIKLEFGALYRILVFVALSKEFTLIMLKINSTQMPIRIG